MRPQKVKLIILVVCLETFALAILSWMFLGNALHVWRYGDPVFESQLVRVPFPGRSDRNCTGKVAVPKFVRGAKLKRFGEFSSTCKYVGDVIHCPDVRLEGETMMRQGHLAIVRIFLIFDLIARKYSLKYWLLRGSLLGAYRSGQMIAHDLDIDVGMLQEDYDQLLKIIRTELPKDLFFQDGSDEPGYPKAKRVTAKIRDLNSCYVTCIDCAWNDGLMIDIFVFKRVNDKVVEVEVAEEEFQFDDIFPVRELDFEGFKALAPKNTPGILETYFGSGYMIPNSNFPEVSEIANPWYSCEYIKNSGDKEKFLAESRIR